MASVSDHIVSFIDGRVRLRHPALKKPDLADMALSVVKSVEGVTDVRVNPVTGSMLLFYDTEKLSREQLLALAHQCSAFLPDEEEGQRKACRGSAGSACRLLSRETTRLVDRALLVSLLCSLAGAAAGLEAVHRVTGAVFAVASLQHLAAHRKALW